MNFKDFKKKHIGGYETLSATETEFPGSRFHKRIKGNCDDMEVVNFLYQPLNGIYTVFLK